MSRVQLALRVADLEGSIAFYSKLFGIEPAKHRPGYANYVVKADADILCKSQDGREAACCAGDGSEPHGNDGARRDRTA